MKITFLGTNALLFSKDKTAILVDPHFTRPGLLNLLGKIRPDPVKITENLARFGIRKVEGVLLTHTHYDHALDAAEVIRQTGGVLYASESAVQLARGTGLGEHTFVQVVPQQAYTIGAFQVHFHPAKHVPFPIPMRWLMPHDSKITHPLCPSAYFWHYQAGATMAIQIDRTLIFGSAGFVTGAYQDLDIETVILGVGGLDLQSPRYIESLYRETVLAPGVKQVFLSHWDDFFRPLDINLQVSLFARRSIPQINKLGRRNGHRVHQLEFGQTLSIN